MSSFKEHQEFDENQASVTGNKEEGKMHLKRLHMMLMKIQKKMK